MDRICVPVWVVVWVCTGGVGYDSRQTALAGFTLYVALLLQQPACCLHVRACTCADIHVLQEHSMRDSMAYDPGLLRQAQHCLDFRLRSQTAVPMGASQNDMQYLSSLASAAPTAPTATLEISEQKQTQKKQFKQRQTIEVVLR